MMFTLRGIHISFWLFVGWVALRVWELNFEVSPLPAWILPVFVFLVLFFLTYGLSRRLQKQHALDRKNIMYATLLLVLGASVWEMGLTLYLNGWHAMGVMLTSRFLVGILVQAIASVLAGVALQRKAARAMPEGLV